MVDVNSVREQSLIVVVVLVILCLSSLLVGYCTKDFLVGVGIDY